MSKQQNAVMAEIRRKEILDLLNAEGHATVNMLCDRFKVSPATIRKDLNDLESMKQLKRTHGGAISMQALPELTSREKMGLHAAQKKAIAKKAMEFICPGQTIAIDTGTTTVELAQLMTEMRDVTIITNDIKVAYSLEENSKLNIVFLGGTVRRGFHCTVGQAAIDQMSRLHVDTLFLATNAMDADWGLSTPSIEMADIKHIMIKNAHRRILLADSSKMNSKSLAKFALLQEIDILITDSGIDDDSVRALKEADIRVICA